MPKTTIVLTRRIYTQNALDRTLESFSKLCVGSYTTTEEDCLLEIEYVGQQPLDEFLNYVLALSAQEQLT